MKTILLLLAGMTVIMPLRAQQTLFGAPTQLTISNGDSLHGRVREDACMKIDTEHNRFSMNVSLASLANRIDSMNSSDAIPAGELTIEAPLPFDADHLLSMYPQAQTLTLNGTATYQGISVPVSFSISLMAEDGIAENHAYGEQLYPYYSSLMIELPLDKFLDGDNPVKTDKDILVVQVVNGLVNKISQPLT